MTDDGKRIVVLDPKGAAFEWRPRPEPIAAGVGGGKGDGHDCVEHLDWIGGYPPYECLVCGRRLSREDIEDRESAGGGG